MKKTPIDHTAELLSELSNAIDQEWRFDDTDAQQCALLHSAAEDLRAAQRKLERVSAIYSREERQTSLRFS